jgi:hypothetical protein
MQPSADLMNRHYMDRLFLISSECIQMATACDVTLTFSSTQHRIILGEHKIVRSCTGMARIARCFRKRFGGFAQGFMKVVGSSVVFHNQP